MLRTCVLLDELIIKEQGGGAGGPVVVVQVGPPVVAHNRSGCWECMRCGAAWSRGKWQGPYYRRAMRHVAGDTMGHATVH